MNSSLEDQKGFRGDFNFEVCRETCESCKVSQNASCVNCPLLNVSSASKVHPQRNGALVNFGGFGGEPAPIDLTVSLAITRQDGTNSCAFAYREKAERGKQE